jgi:hypothetical protein
VIKRQSRMWLFPGALVVILFLGFGSSQVEQQQRSVEGLIATADAILVAEILSTDYTATPADGPMVAVAKVWKVLKGRFTSGKRFRFAETAWVGPTYQKGEYRVLFLEKTKSREAAKASPWWILSHLSARRDYFIDKDSIPNLSRESLGAFMKKIQE